MACGRWIDDWVARLYDELDVAATRDCDEHLAHCGECRARMERLSTTRSILREHAPRVSSAPRVFVLPARRAWPAVWGFAAGAACMVAALGLGLALRPANRPTDPAPAEALAALRQELEELRRIQAVAAPLTREEVDSELERMKRRIDRERQDDLELLMRSLTASELRTGSWIDETREALQVIALRQDPRFSER